MSTTTTPPHQIIIIYMNMWSRISTLQLRFIKFIELHSSTGEIDSIQLFFVSSRQFSTPTSLVQWLQAWNHQHYHHCRRRHNHEIWMGLDSREILIFLTLWWNDTPHPTKQTFPHLVSEYQQQHSHSIQTFFLKRRNDVFVFSSLCTTIVGGPSNGARQFQIFECRMVNFNSIDCRGRQLIDTRTPSITDTK